MLADHQLASFVPALTGKVDSGLADDSKIDAKLEGVRKQLEKLNGELGLQDSHGCVRPLPHRNQHLSSMM